MGDEYDSGYPQQNVPENNPINGSTVKSISTTKIVLMVVGALVVLGVISAFVAFKFSSSLVKNGNIIPSIPGASSTSSGSDDCLGSIKALPSDFPSDFLLYPEQEITCVTDFRTLPNWDQLKDTFFSAAGYLAIDSKSDNPPSVVYDWYKATYAGVNGWDTTIDLTPEKSIAIGIQTENYTVSFRNNKQYDSSLGEFASQDPKSPFFFLSISPSGSGSKILVTYGEGDTFKKFDSDK